MSESTDKPPQPASADAQKPQPQPAAKARRSFENPALKAMGINRIRLPSRNWSIFWAVTGSVTALYFWDRYERKRVRQEWKDKVAFLAKQPMQPTDLPRKVTVYIAPPPGDFLDLGFAHFRQYIKPILTAAAVDFEVKSETKQGQIRNQVAEEIRNERRKALGLPVTVPEGKKNDETDDQIQRLLTGQLHRDETGGVICVGRGAYKEYLNGLQEGWLGPLDPPQEVLDDLAEQAKEKNKDKAKVSKAEEKVDENIGEAAKEVADRESNATQSTPVTLDEATSTAASKDIAESIQEVGAAAKEQDEDLSSEDSKPKDIPVPKPYIKREEYGNVELPREFHNARIDTIAAIGFPHMLGFLTIPVRIYKFFNRRKLADEMGRATTAVILSPARPFDLTKDVDALVEEEEDWPTKWKKRGLENNSEWMQEFVVDPKMAERLTVYEEYTGERVSEQRS